MTAKSNFEANTLDDLLREVLENLLACEDRVFATRSEELGPFSEVVGASIALFNPRARLSRSESKGKVFSALGEFLWYMSGKNSLEFIKYYVPAYEKESTDGKSVSSGYGDRLFGRFGIDQVEEVIRKLRESDTTRQAVIQIFAAGDTRERSVPCTCTLQFLLRNKQLVLIVNMRSNDAYWGLAHDVFAFTMLQELIARRLGADVGIYRHFVGSLHLYDSHREKAKAFIDEGWQNTIAMEPMPAGDPTEPMKRVQECEARLRAGEALAFDALPSETYWRDICILLAIFQKIKSNEPSACAELKRRLHGNYFHSFINDRLSAQVLGHGKS